jgi:hypothetical protein
MAGVARDTAALAGIYSIRVMRNRPPAVISLGCPASVAPFPVRR